MSEQSQKPVQENQLRRELLGVLGLSPFVAYNSAARRQMFSSHITQSLVIEGSTERFIQTGMEQEYGKYTFNVKMPVDAEIIRVIERYPRTLDESSIGHNPETLIIFEDVDTKEVGCLSLVDYFTHHQYFGFAYKRCPAVTKLRKGEFVSKGTILLDSPAVTDQGGYKYGRECNVAFMSHPAVAEDGFIVSRDILKQFRFKTYETRIIEWGSRSYPLNLYGDINTYKPHPDIGDLVRSDGVLMALRQHSDNFAPVEMSARRTREIDPIFDTCYYAAGPGQIKDGRTASGRVIDIKVMHDPESTVPTTPVGMELQTNRYNDARMRYYKDIYDVYQNLKRQRGKALTLTHEFNRLVVESISVLGAIKPVSSSKEAPERVSKLHRGIPLDDWRVEFVIEYTVEPTIGFKLTDTMGGKGVICHIAEPHEMPVDEAGNRADIVIDPNARISRMNLGGLYEPYINAASRDLAKEIKSKLFGIQVVPIGWQLKNPDQNMVAHCWSRLMRYLQIVTPHTYQHFLQFDNKTIVSYLESIIKNGMIYLYYPPDNQAVGMDMIEQIQKEFAPTYGPVTYTGYSGKKCTTVSNVRIGSMYIMLLEKTGDDWTAVSSGKWQNFGVLAQINNRDKYTKPTRDQAIRAWGETEIRIATAYAGPIVASEILDRNNNMLSHKQMLTSILEAKHPTNIGIAVDRSVNPLGNARPLQLVKHYAMCGGWEFSYSPHRSGVDSGLVRDVADVIADLKEKSEID
jgi:DNA-directed RNA polymerase beta subunit